MSPITGTIAKAIQKLPVRSISTHASTAPTMKKSPWATLMKSSRPKMIDSPSAISATIRPHTKPFKTRTGSSSKDTLPQPDAAIMPAW